MNYMATNHKKIEPTTDNQIGTPPEVTPSVPPVQPEVKVTTPKKVVSKSEVKLQDNQNITELIIAMQKQIMELQTQISKTDAKVDEKNFLASNTTKEDEKLHETKAERMKKHLLSQSTVRIMVNLEGKEVRGKSVETVILNGYRLNIPKGVYVDVPEQVADVIKNYQTATDEALHNEFEITDDKKEKTPLTALEG